MSVFLQIHPTARCVPNTGGAVVRDRRSWAQCANLQHSEAASGGGQLMRRGDDIRWSGQSSRGEQGEGTRKCRGQRRGGASGNLFRVCWGGNEPLDKVMQRKGS